VLCKEEENLSPSASDVVVRSQGSKEEPEAATANSTKPIAMDLPVEDPMATGVDASVGRDTSDKVLPGLRYGRWYLRSFDI
jgi:hypothetical protein